MTHPRNLVVLLLLVLSVTVASAPAQAQAQAAEPESAARARGRRMLTEALGSNGAYRLVEGLCEAAPRRFAGTPAAAAAVEWGRQEMERIGLSNVRLEPVTVPRWVRGKVCDVAALAAGGGRVPLRALALGGSVGTPPEGLEAPVVEVDHLDTLKREIAAGSDRFRDRIVFINQAWDATKVSSFESYGEAVQQRVHGASEAAKGGALAVLIRSVTSAPDDAPHTGAMRYQADVPRIPTAALSVVGAERLHALLAEGAVRLRLAMDCRMLPDAPSANVVGEIPGRELPEEIVLIGGHLDAWDVGEGAHDDGAGIAHVLEAARLILASGEAPRRTIRVVLFMNEEWGLSGALAYAAQHADAIDQHVLALESDSGGFAPLGIGVNGEATKAALAPVTDVLEALGLGRLLDGGGGADISPLMAQGVPGVALRVVNDRYFDYHHSEKDTPDKVNPRELARGAATVAILALGVADLEEAPPRE